MFRISRRRTLIALGVVGLLVVSGIAVAYFSSNGSGTGTATVGTSSTLTLHGTTASTLYPGSSSTVNFTVDNSSSGHEQLGTIHLASIVACNTAFVSGACPSGHEVTTCESVETGSSDTNTANFWMADVPANQDFGTGNGQTVTATGTLKMNDLSTNQDSCKNANLLLNLTS